MIGGDSRPVQRLDPIFKTIAPGSGIVEPTPGRAPGSTASHGYLHCGPSGAGHFVKMVHNGVEYGMMAAIAEGLSIIKHADAGLHQDEIDAETTPLRDPEAYQYEINVADVAEVWRRGSVVSSWLVDLIAAALAKSPDLDDFSGHVSDSGEGRWTVLAAVDEGVPALGDLRVAVRAVRVAGQRRVHREDPVRDAFGIRRARGEEEVSQLVGGRIPGRGRTTTSSCCSARPATWPSASCCRACTTSIAPGCCPRSSGSSGPSPQQSALSDEDFVAHAHSAITRVLPDEADRFVVG